MCVLNNHQGVILMVMRFFNWKIEVVPPFADRFVTCRVLLLGWLLLLKIGRTEGRWLPLAYILAHTWRLVLHRTSFLVLSFIAIHDHDLLRICSNVDYLVLCFFWSWMHRRNGGSLLKSSLTWRLVSGCWRPPSQSLAQLFFNIFLRDGKSSSTKSVLSISR